MLVNAPELVSLLRDLANLLTSQPSSLVYYLLVLFALELAFSMAVSRYRHAPDGPTARLAVGSGLALLLRGLFGIGTLLIVFNILAPQWQPPIDRAVALAMLLLVGWALLSPGPARWLDILLVFSLVAVLVGAVADLLFWLPLGFSNVQYNLSLADIAWQIAILASSALLFLLLLFRRPPEWGVGLSLPLLWMAAAGLHLYIGLTGEPLAGDFDGWRRVAELAIYPIFTSIVYQLTLRSLLQTFADRDIARDAAQSTDNVAPVALLAAPAETPAEPPTEPDPNDAAEPLPVSETTVPPLEDLLVQTPPHGMAAFVDTGGKPRTALTAEAAAALVEINVQPSPEATARSITRAVARALLADITLLWLPPINDSLITAAGYDLIREIELSPLSIAAERLPTLNSALKRGKPARLRPTQQMGELIVLADAMKAHQTGPAFMVPLFHEGEILGGLMVFSPHAQRNWSTEEQRLLDAISGPIAAALHLARTQPERDALAERLEQVEDELQRTADHAAQIELALNEALTERSTYRAEIDTLTESLRRQDATSADEAAVRQMSTELAQLRDSLTALREQRARLEGQLATAEKSKNATVDALKARLKVLQAERKNIGQQNMALTRANSLAQLDLEQAQKDWQAERSTLLVKINELNAAVTDLRTAQEAATAASTNGEAHPEPAEAPPSPADSAALPSTGSLELARQLRTPMGSVLKTTDQLLTEALGAIGIAQRRHLERIRANVTRMSTLIDALFDATAKENGASTLVIEPVDVLDIVDEALMACSTQFRDKNIVLSINIADNLPTIYADQEALNRVLRYLLSNAFVVTPSKGEVRIQASISESADETRARYLLIAITDAGGGIDPVSQSRVFNQTWRAANPAIPGLAPDDGSELAVAKTLVEAHHGRLWFESQPDEATTTFNVLLPMSPDQVESAPGDYLTPPIPPTEPAAS